MITSTLSPIRRTIRRIREICAELGYAQRRLTEIRTGLSLSAARER
jgi:hypothetical protein